MRLRLTIVFALARTTVAEAIRDRLLSGILLFAVGLILLSVVASNLTLGYRLRIVTDFSMSAITFAGTTIALLQGVGAVAREIEKRTATTLLAKPVSRSEYVAGKYLGVVATSWFNLLLMSIPMTLVISFYRDGTPNAFAWTSYGATLSLAFVRVALAGAVAVSFSAVASTTVAFVGALGVIASGYVSRDLVQLLSRSDSSATQTLGRALHYVLPDFGTLDTLARLLHSHSVLTSDVGFAVAYAMAYAVALLMISSFALSRRDVG